MVRTIETGPTGAKRFYATGERNSSANFFWPGPGGHLYLEIGYKNVTSILHPSADGVYYTAKEVMKAIRAFMGRGR